MKHFSLDKQDLADIWVKYKMDKNYRKAMLLFKKGLRWNRKMKNKDWQEERKKWEDAFFAQKALMNNAPSKLPYQTLALIGRFLATSHQEELMRRIISDNALSFEGKVYVLDDPESQQKVLRALKSEHFSPIKNYEAA